MQFTDLAEMNHAIFRKMRDYYKTGRFGLPVSLGIHVGCGTEKFTYQALPMMSDMIKIVFLAGIRAAIEHHKADWAVVTMDAYSILCKPTVDAELYQKVDKELLIKAGLATRTSVLTQFAQTRDGQLHTLSATQIDGEDRTFGPVQEIVYEKGSAIGNMMLFQPPTEEIVAASEIMPEAMNFIGKFMPFESVAEV